MNKLFLPQFYLIFILLTGCYSKEINISKSEVIKLHGEIYYQFNDGKFLKHEFIMEDTFELKKIIKIINNSERSTYNGQRMLTARLDLYFDLKGGECEFVQVSITENVGTLLEYYSECEGTKYIKGRFSNLELEHFLINYFKGIGIDIDTPNTRFHK